MTGEIPMRTAESDTMRELAEVRLALYRFLSAALSRPTPEQHAWLRGPQFRRALDVAAERFGLPRAAGEIAPDGYADYESRYIACFEVGLPAPPVPLLASNYNRREPVPAIIHEHVLVYKRFGLSLPEGDTEPADHLLHELAFLIRLDELLTAGRRDADSLLLARRDFLQRHAARWVPRAAAEADEKGLPAIYRLLLALLAQAVRHDLELTREAVDSPAGDTP
jgi:DMSO reductase family type II enzyme chaperone